MQITCNTLGAHNVQHVMRHMVRRDSSAIKSDRVEVAFQNCRGAGIAQLVVLRLAVHSVAGSILLWGNFLVEGIFPLELTWVQTPVPQKLQDESINGGLVCAHMHFIARTQKILTFMS